MNDENAKELLVSIAVQAVIDYREAYRKHEINSIRLKRLKNTAQTQKVKNEIKGVKSMLSRSEIRMEEIESFFKSRWGVECTGHSGDVTIKMIRERLAADNMEDREGIWRMI